MTLHEEPVVTSRGVLRPRLRLRAKGIHTCGVSQAQTVSTLSGPLQNELLVDVEDGIVVGLYHFLWLKDGKGRPCPEVNIPHTVRVGRTASMGLGQPRTVSHR